MQDELPKPLAPAGRPGGRRIAIAVVVSLGFLTLGLAYHDGIIWTDDLGSIEDPGSYRVRGTVESVDTESGTFTLRSGDTSRTLRWNVTTPEVGRAYVVAAAILDDGTLEALALSAIFVFR
jgi:hypothetical protein